jgi:antirestriction protein
MTTFYAQPYDISANGFFFETAEEFTSRIGSVVNDYGQPVEEFEIQFIDGEAIDAAFARAWEINQANILRFMEAVEEWEEDEKRRFILAVGECGYAFNPESDDPSDLDVDIYPVDSLRELAEQFVDDGLFGPIPEQLAFYIDYDAIARDLAVDYTETEIAGERIVYRCG